MPPQKQQPQHRKGKQKQGGSKKQAAASSGSHAKPKAAAAAGPKRGVSKPKSSSAPHGLAAAVSGFGGSLMQEALGDLHEAGIKLPRMRQGKKDAGHAPAGAGPRTAETPAVPAVLQQAQQTAKVPTPAAPPANISSLLGGWKL